MHSDLVEEGQPYKLVHEICGMPTGLYYNVYSLNHICATDHLLDDWRGKVVAHEERHRDSLNDCIVRVDPKLDAFADRLAAMMADATLPEHVQNNARGALAGAADLDPGSFPRGAPYPRGFDLLVRAYEGGVDDWLLHTIVWVDPERGPAYVRDVLERSERPPICRWRYDRDDGWLSAIGWWTPDTPLPGCDGYDFWEVRDTPWCEAGGLLYRDRVRGHPAGVGRRRHDALRATYPRPPWPARAHG